MLGAGVPEAEVLAEKGHHKVLEAIGDRTCVGSLVDLKAVLQTVLIEWFVEFDGISLRPSLSPRSMEMPLYRRRLPMY